MPKKIVSYTLSEKSIEEIDKRSKALGVSRSELIEFLISKGFQFPDEVEANLNEISKLQEQTEETKKAIRNRRE